MKVVMRKELDELLDAYDRKLQCGKYDPLLRRRIVYHATAPYRRIRYWVRFRVWLLYWWARCKWWPGQREEKLWKE